MRLVILGAPGSGKGTQTDRLKEKYNAVHLSTGDLLRAAVAAGTEVGRRAKQAMDAGALVADEIVLQLIREKVTGDHPADRFILDGFPRNIPQAEALDDMLQQIGKPLENAVLIDLDQGVLLKRIVGRRSCPACGAIFNVYFAPPRREGVCDRCGGILKHRDDDNEETVQNRLKTYQEQTEPLIAYYRHQGILSRVEGDRNVDDVTADIETLLEEGG